MPATAPPFPSAGSPHLDIEMRELYSRLMAAERALGIGEGSPSVPPVTDLTLKVVEATPVKLLQQFVRFDQGWAGPVGPQPRSAPAFLGNPIPPFVVLDVIVNIDVVFNYDLRSSRFLGVGTSAETEVNPRFYYAGSQSTLFNQWLGRELNLGIPDGHSEDERYANIGVVQTSFRPIIAGFFHNPSAPIPFDDWPADMQGQVQVLVIYADSEVGGKAVRLSELGEVSLLAPEGF